MIYIRAEAARNVAENQNLAKTCFVYAELLAEFSTWPAKLGPKIITVLCRLNKSCWLYRQHAACSMQQKAAATKMFHKF